MRQPYVIPSPWSGAWFLTILFAPNSLWFRAPYSTQAGYFFRSWQMRSSNWRMSSPLESRCDRIRWFKGRWWTELGQPLTADLAASPGVPGWNLGLLDGNPLSCWFVEQRFQEIVNKDWPYLYVSLLPNYDDAIRERRSTKRFG
jgi:hypothetical protein